MCQRIQDARVTYRLLLLLTTCASQRLLSTRYTRASRCYHNVGNMAPGQFPHLLEARAKLHTYRKMHPGTLSNNVTPHRKAIHNVTVVFVSG
jgi:hypothetical protein